VGADDSVFVVGTTRGDLDSARNLSGQSPFLLKLAPDGAPVWTALLGGEARAEGKALGLAADGQTIYVTGEIEVPREGYSEFSPYLLVMSVDWPASDQPSLYSTVIHHTLVAE